MSTLLNTDENHHKELKYELPIKISQKKKKREHLILLFGRKNTPIYVRSPEWAIEVDAFTTNTKIDC